MASMGSMPTICSCDPRHTTYTDEWEAHFRIYICYNTEHFMLIKSLTQPFRAHGLYGINVNFAPVILSPYTAHTDKWEANSMNLL